MLWQIYTNSMLCKYKGRLNDAVHYSMDGTGGLSEVSQSDKR